MEAKKIDEAKVKNGRLIKVINQKRKMNAKAIYYSVWVEDADGKNERCILLTERELKIAEERARKNSEDTTKKGFITDLLD